MKKLFEGWGVKILVNDPYKDCDGCHKVSKKDLLKSSDVVFLHVHVTDETREMVNDSFLSLMKKNSYLINTSRGELVDEQAIIKFIKNGHLKGYGTDVIETEFLDIKKSPIIKNLNKYNIIVTPHIGGMTYQGQLRAWNFAVEKFKKN